MTRTRAVLSDTWQTVLWISACLAGAVLLVCGLVAIAEKPIPCLDAHVERRHVPAHNEAQFLPRLGFDGKIHLDLETVAVPARDVDVTICDRYAAEQPESE